MNEKMGKVIPWAVLVVGLTLGLMEIKYGSLIFTIAAFYAYDRLRVEDLDRAFRKQSPRSRRK